GRNGGGQTDEPARGFALDASTERPGRAGEAAHLVRHQPTTPPPESAAAVPASESCAVALPPSADEPPSRLSGFLSSAAWLCAALPHPVADPTITPPSTRSRKSFLNSMVPPWKDIETTRVGWERHPLSVGSACHELAGRHAIADPAVPRSNPRPE